MKMMTCIEDLRQAAGRKVPRALSDFVEGGSYAEQTLAANCAELQRIKLCQRVLIDVSNRSTRSAILGEPVKDPDKIIKATVLRKRNHPYEPATFESARPPEK